MKEGPMVSRVHAAGSGVRPRLRGAPREGKAETQSRRGLVLSILLVTLLLHAGALALFGLLKIAEFFKEPEASFVVSRKAPRLPAPTREHRIKMAEHQAMAPRPVLRERLVSARPQALALPELPKVPVDQMLPLDPAALLTDQLVQTAMGPSLTAAGLGGKGGQAGEGGRDVGGMSFFNIRDRARSVVIMIDVSASMFGRTGDLDYGSGKLLRRGREQAFQSVREEVFRLIDGLTAASRFGLIHWSGSARLWQDQLVPATLAEREAAKLHVQQQVDYNKAGPRGGRPGGTRHDYALEALLQLAPETAFMLTDGNATRSLGKGKFEVIEVGALLDLIETATSPPPRIHTIYYLTGKDKRDEEHLLRRLARRTGGQFRKQKATFPAQ